MHNSGVILENSCISFSRHLWDLFFLSGLIVSKKLIDRKGLGSDWTWKKKVFISLQHWVILQRLLPKNGIFLHYLGVRADKSNKNP